MWTTIAMWGGVAGLFVSIFAVIIIYLTRKNILDILDKDVILFSRNFELKKTAIENSFKLADEIQTKGGQIILNTEFNERAKKIYNELLCVVSDVRVADEFYSLAIENNSPITEARIAQFKLHCRKDIGLSVKKSNNMKRNAKLKDENLSTESDYNQATMSGVQFANNSNPNVHTNNIQNTNTQPRTMNQPQYNPQSFNQNSQPKTINNPVGSKQSTNTVQNPAPNQQPINSPINPNRTITNNNFNKATNPPQNNGQK